MTTPGALPGNHEAAASGSMRGRRWYRALGWVVLALSLVYFVNFIHDHAEELRQMDWSAATAVAFVLAVLLFSADQVIAMGGWLVLLRAAGEPLSVRSTAIVFFISQFSKYLPGNVAQHAGRIVLARSHGAATGKVVLSMLVEIALVMGAAALFTLLSLWLTRVPVVGLSLVGGQRTIAVIALPATLVLAAALVWWLRRRGASLPVLRQHALGIVAVLCLFLIGLLLLALCTMVLATRMFGAVQNDVFFYGAATTLAWLAGFLAPGAPAGLGVREAAMVALLEPAIGARGALGTTLAFRLVSVAADGLQFAAASVLHATLRKTA